jgi:hypothetical protein
VISAISLYEKPSTSASSTAILKFSGIDSSAALTSVSGIFSSTSSSAERSTLWAPTRSNRNHSSWSSGPSTVFGSRCFLRYVLMNEFVRIR